MGYVEEREVFEEYMVQDALQRGLIKSCSSPPVPVYMIWIMGYYLVIVQNSEDVELILADHDHFDKVQFGLGCMDLLFGDDIALSPEWKRQRKVVNLALRRGCATSLFGTHARSLIRKLDAIAASGAIMDPAEWMERMALNALKLVAFSDNINHPESPIVVTYNTLMAENADLGKLLNLLYKWSKDGKPMLALIEQFDRFSVDMIDSKMTEIADKRAVGFQGDDQDARNLLEMMIEAAEGTNFSREDSRANTVIFFVTGYDTTVNALSLSSYLLGLHPEVQGRARQEFISIMGDAGPTTPAE